MPARNQTYRPTAVRSLFTAHCSHSAVIYSFSAKERDAETGLSYFGARYYSSDLSIWLSVDPMSDKYPSLSPYVYCANNPVRCVDPNGEDLIPSQKFKESTYYGVYRKLLTNSVYKELSSAYTKNNSINLHLDYNYNPFTSDAGRTGLTGSTVSCTNGVASKAEIYSEYGRPHGTELSEIVKVQVLLHEMVHSDNDLKKIKTPNHTGFDRESVLKGLIEYNNTNNLGYSKEDLEIISWMGLEKSDEFKEYIKQKSENSGRTLDEEKQSFENNLNMLRINQGPNTEKNE